MWLAARRLPSLTLQQRRALIEDTLVRLRRIGAHTAAEERVFYPMLARLLGTPSIGAALASDHRYVRARMQYLAETDPASTAALQALLYGLHAVITTHVEKEDELLAPLVERAESGRRACEETLTASASNRAGVGRTAPPRLGGT
jgi:hypothetical protein